MLRRLGCVVLAVCAVSCASPAPIAPFVMEGVVGPDVACGYTLDSPLLLGGMLDTDSSVSPSVRALGIRYVAVVRAAYHHARPFASWCVELATVDSAVIEVRDALGRRIDFGALPNPYRVAAALRIEGDYGGLGTVELFPLDYGDMLAGLEGDIVLSVRLRGSDCMSGAMLETPPQEFPIHLCAGCLFTCGAADAPSCAPGQDQTSVVRCAP